MDTRSYARQAFTTPKSGQPYPPEFRRQMAGRARTGRSLDDLAGEFKPSSSSIRNWVGQAAREEGVRDGRSLDERQEVRRAAEAAPRDPGASCFNLPHPYPIRERQEMLEVLGHEAPPPAREL